jgi:hypothetical protein
LLFVLSLCVPLLEVFAQDSRQSLEPKPSEDRPVLELDLRKYGYKSYLTNGRDSLSLAFTESNDIVIGWSKLDDPHADKTMRTNNPVPTHLHALLIDSRTGQEKSVHEWPSSHFDTTIIPVASREYLTCTGDKIQRLSSDFTLLQAQMLSLPGTCNEIRTSRSRHSVRVNTSEGKKYQGSIIDAVTFQPLASWSLETMSVNFTDSMLVGIRRQDLELCILKFGRDWEPFNAGGIGQQLKLLPNKSAVFVNDSTLLVLSGGKMRVVTLAGKMLFQVDLPNKMLFSMFSSSVAISASGDRFAFVETQRHGSVALDMDYASDDHVVVYSLREQQAIYTRKVHGTSPYTQSWNRNRFTLSPDGRLLAIFDKGILDVYQLPAMSPD